MDKPIDTPNDVLQAGETSATIDPPLPNPLEMVRRGKGSETSTITNKI